MADMKLPIFRLELDHRQLDSIERGCSQSIVRDTGLTDDWVIETELRCMRYPNGTILDRPIKTPDDAQDNEKLVQQVMLAASEAVRTECSACSFRDTPDL